jgi:flagellar basal-body rod protein FlgB
MACRNGLSSASAIVNFLKQGEKKMESGGLFKGAFPVLENALDLRAMRHHLIVSNIANKDTPNYKAFDIMVEEELSKSMKPGDATQLKRTDDAHLPSSKSSGTSGKIGEATGQEFSLREDGNSVDIDREMAKLSENNLLYDALAQIISRKFKGLEDAIKGGV